MAANGSQRTKWLPLAILAAALVIWAALLALGAFLELGADQPRHDFRKPMLVLGAMAVFLAVWGLALWMRGRRQRGK
jgi:membrane protein DedA with SNARE-associated domain